MITATPELAMPGTELGGVETGQIGTPAQDHARLISKVAEAARSHVPAFTDGQARPVTGETPIPASLALAAVKAVRVGSEEPAREPVKRDALHWWEIFLSPLTGKSIWLRLGKGRQAIPIAIQRIRDKMTRQPESKDQLNFGE